MKCLICNVDAVKHLRPGLWLETECSAGCGHFRISAELVIKNRTFDVNRSRHWLELARRGNEFPMISGYDYATALLEGPGSSDSNCSR